MTKGKEGTDVLEEEKANTPQPYQPGNQIAKASRNDNAMLTTIDMEEEMPDMDQGVERLPLDLASEYWTPESSGESRRFVFSHFASSLVPDKYGPSKGVNGETVELETAHFFEKVGGEIKSVRQASKVLLGSLKTHNIKMGTLLEIVYLGKKKLNNGNTGDSWAIYPLKVLQK